MDYYTYEEIKRLSAGKRELYFATLLAATPPTKGEDGVAMTPTLAFELFELLAQEGLAGQDFIAFYGDMREGCVETRMILSIPIAGVKLYRTSQGWRISCYPEEESRYAPAFQRVTPKLNRLYQKALQHTKHQQAS